jgi:hypothetical protein
LDRPTSGQALVTGRACERSASRFARSVHSSKLPPMHPSRDLRRRGRETDHEEFDEYDRVMAEKRRVAVFVEPELVYGTG